jgi:hypothetical protein
MILDDHDHDHDRDHDLTLVSIGEDPLFASPFFETIESSRGDEPSGEQYL